jgi:hypothetical protein
MVAPVAFAGFGRFLSGGESKTTRWVRMLTADGVDLRRTATGSSDDSLGELADSYIAQLIDEGHLQENENGGFLSWDAFFSVIESGSYPDISVVMRLPSTTTAKVSLRSNGSLIDDSFTIAIGNWTREGAQPETPELHGALLHFADRVELMNGAQWSLVKAVVAFAVRSSDERTDEANRLAWATIRRKALRAQASLSDFLFRSIVLAPERLTINWLESTTTKGVLEINPGFDGAPQEWLQTFDRNIEVLNRYDIPSQDGIVQVLVAPAVRVVLEEIKRMPARRIAGSRAQAFLANPFALLGEDGKSAIDEAQFEAAKELAGLRYERFVPIIERGPNGSPSRIGLLIESASSSGLAHSQTEWLSDAKVVDLVGRVRDSIARAFQFIAWEGYDFEIQGDTELHADMLWSALEEKRRPGLLVTYDEVYDLSGYSQRIEGIGTEKPYYSPFIAKQRQEEGWFPENVQQLIGVATHDGVDDPVPVTQERMDEMIRLLDEAVACKNDTVAFPWLSQPMAVEEAKDIVSSFGRVHAEVASGSFSPRPEAKRCSSGAKRLILKGNISSIDYEEARKAALFAGRYEANLPSTLLPGVKLLPHQLEGIGWLQHLFRLREDYEVRGAILADDMGLGKTVQLLTFMASIIEAGPDALPMLVVAPVALLENWEEEAAKFLKKDTLQILTAYGPALSELRIPRDSIDQRLRMEDGLDKFFWPDWIGSARVVLTTYETLRDYEFAFSRQRWSVMICDEAQRIKNPAAMVTRSAKKPNVQFKIACTGTPVENALVDLWCLFDFVQPGLLGALNAFGQRYSKPIEAKTDEEKIRVEELRERIAPQILRRTKAEIAQELPAKTIVEDCRALQISALQRSLYARALEDYRNRNVPGVVVPFKNHLGLLQYLRAICTDPQRHGQTIFKPETLKEYRVKAPKLDWLLQQLLTIKSQNEKAIIFCEFREIQRLLHHYIREAVGFSAEIINGDTTASSTSDSSRQKRIRSFQSTPGFGVIILSPLAVGFGVNIQAANHVIHYTRTWNPAKEDQATDRAYRIGQTKEVFVYYPTITAPDFITFEKKLDALLTRKRELASDMLNGAGDVSFDDFILSEVAPGGYAKGGEEPITIDALHRMTARYFECFIAAVWSKKGYDCRLTPSSGDNGIDVVAVKGTAGILLQVKSSGTADSRLNWEAVKDVVTGAAFYERQYKGVQFTKACVTNRYFNEGAHENARLNGVEMFDQDRLAAFLTQSPVYAIDVDRWAYTA